MGKKSGARTSGKTGKSGKSNWVKWRGSDASRAHIGKDALKCLQLKAENLELENAILKTAIRETLVLIKSTCSNEPGELSGVVDEPRGDQCCGD